MNQSNSNTFISDHKRGKHLSLIDRSILMTLHYQGKSNRAIAKVLN